jgi:hypothetical protein
VEATGPGNLSYGLLFTQSIVRTLDGGTSCNSLYNATPVLDLLEPKGLKLECGSDMNITSCNDGDGQSKVIPATLSSQDIAQELLRLRDDSSHGQAVRSSGSTTGTGHDEGSTSSQRVPLQDVSMVSRREDRVIGVVSQESSGSTQANGANLSHSSQNLIATSVSSTIQPKSTGQTREPTTWQFEWNRLASHATPGTQAHSNVEVYQRPIPQDMQHHDASSSNPSNTFVQPDIEEQFYRMTKIQLQQYCHNKHIDITGLSLTETLSKAIHNATHGTPEPKVSTNARHTSRTDVHRW